MNYKPAGVSANGDGKVDADKLNERVKAITQKKMDESMANKTPLPLDISAALKPKSAIWAGYPIYEDRMEFPVYFCTVFWLCVSAYFVYQRGIFQMCVYLAVMLVVYDFYSGILHVVCDNPANINLPLFGQPALEFQWHHYIPNDITSKSLVQACGDLNVAMAANIAACAVMSLFIEDSLSLWGVMGLKVLMAYYGQFSHRSAHDHFAHRNPLIKALQSTGLLVSARDHKLHHTAPHDLDFCLVGICNPLFDRMNKWITNPETSRWVWLIAFIGWTIVDVPLIHMTLSKVLN